VDRHRAHGQVDDREEEGDDDGHPAVLAGLGCLESLEVLELRTPVRDPAEVVQQPGRDGEEHEQEDEALHDRRRKVEREHVRDGPEQELPPLCTEPGRVHGDERAEEKREDLDGVEDALEGIV
jgi:hypothetical protein